MTQRPPSVVVVTWNAAELVPACLDSLLAQRPVVPEIVVVDNGSSDDTVELISREYPGVVLVCLAHNAGFTGGANAGIAAAAGDTVILLNNDATADPAFVDRLVSTLNCDPGAGAVTGLILLADRYAPDPDHTQPALVAFDGTRWRPRPGGRILVNSTGGEITRSANGRDRDWLVPLDELTRKSGTAAAFSGGAVALRRAARPPGDPVDAELFMYYEDSDLSMVLRRTGWRILFERSAVAHHRHAASSGTGTEFFLFHNERNRILFAMTHAPAGVVIAAFARTVVSAGVALLRARPAVARRKAKAIGAALANGRHALARRKALDRRATVPRSALWNALPRG
jgi:N-acetylglucosaminyl-diphospho-decaprenol L-rhamnosyltransferase